MRKRGFALSLGLPEDATSDCARVTLSGQSAALVEGQHGVIELTESRVRLRTGRGVLTVQGEGLRLRALSVDAALIEGHVLTATYARGRASAMNLTLELSGLNLERLLRAAGSLRRSDEKRPPDGRANHARRRAGRAEKEDGRALRKIRLADGGNSGGRAAEARKGRKKAMDARRSPCCSASFGSICPPK